MGEDCPVFDGMFEFCQLSAGGSVGMLSVLDCQYFGYYVSRLHDLLFLQYFTTYQFFPCSSFFFCSTFTVFSVIVSLVPIILMFVFCGMILKRDFC